MNERIENPAWAERGNRHENQVIRIADLVVTKRPPMLVDQAFVNCELVGPAVLVVLDGCSFEHSSLPGPGALWQIDEDREYIGGIGVERCLFRQVAFRDVGLAGAADFVQRFMDNLRGL